MRKVRGVGEVGVFPFTVDSRNRFAYVGLGSHVGFDRIDLQTGQVANRVFAGDTPIPPRTHGVALTPEERELWLCDPVGRKLHVFDATVASPRLTGHVNLSAVGHGWVTINRDERFAWCHTPDAIDVRSKKMVATLKDEQGRPVCGLKFIEVHFRDGKAAVMGAPFGPGRIHLFCLGVTSRHLTNPRLDSVRLPLLLAPGSGF